MPEVPAVVGATDVARVPEQLHQPVVVRDRDNLSVRAARHGVDVRAVRVLRPDALHGPPQRARPRVPARVFQRRREAHRLALRDLPEQQLVVPGGALQVPPVLGPVHARDVRAVTLAHAHALVRAVAVVEVDEVVVRRDGEPPAARREFQIRNLLAPVLLRRQLVPGGRLEHDEPAALESARHEGPVRRVRRAARLARDVAHGDLPALVHVEDPQRLVVPGGDELRQKRVRGQTPQLARLRPRLLVRRGGVPLRDDPAVHAPRRLRGHVELENLRALRAHQKLRALQKHRLDAGRLTVVTAQRLPLRVRDRLHHPRHVHGERALEVLRVEVHLPVLAARHDVLLVHEHIVYRALVQRVVFM